MPNRWPKTQEDFEKAVKMVDHKTHLVQMVIWYGHLKACLHQRNLEDSKYMRQFEHASDAELLKAKERLCNDYISLKNHKPRS